MPRCKRGILEISKDPRHPILFSFNAKKGEEWPSDEEDSDYQPRNNSESDENNRPSSSKCKKKAVKRCKKIKNKTATINDRVGKQDPSVKVVVPFQGNIPHLPSEIWEKIFLYIVKFDGALPFLNVASKVCQLWKEISMRPTLWGKVDLSYGWFKTSEASFKRFCTSRLLQCVSLNVSGCAFMSNRWAVKAVTDNCPNLLSVNLSNCKKLPVGTVIDIVKCCKKLEDINISCTTLDSVSPTTLKYVARTCGVNLKKLVITSTFPKSFNVLIENLEENCPNLEHLDVSFCVFSSDMVTLDITKLQDSFPKLKVLCMADVSVVGSAGPHDAQNMNGVGFPVLEELNLAVVNRSFLTDDFVKRFLKTSVNLQSLDLRGNAKFVVDTLLDVPIKDLKKLLLARTGAQHCLMLKDVINKWVHSLTHLDLSWMSFSDNVLEPALEEFCDREPASGLEYLNLAGTNVKMCTIKNMLRNLPRLEFLDLSSCRDVDRGFKRAYTCSTEIKTLMESMNL